MAARHSDPHYYFAIDILALETECAPGLHAEIGIPICSVGKGAGLTRAVPTIGGVVGTASRLWRFNQEHSIN